MRKIKIAVCSLLILMATVIPVLPSEASTIDGKADLSVNKPLSSGLNSARAMCFDDSSYQELYAEERASGTNYLTTYTPNNNLWLNLGTPIDSFTAPSLVCDNANHKVYSLQGGSNGFKMFNGVSAVYSTLSNFPDSYMDGIPFWDATDSRLYVYQGDNTNGHQDYTAYYNGTSWSSWSSSGIAAQSSGHFGAAMSNGMPPVHVGSIDYFFTASNTTSGMKFDETTHTWVLLSETGKSSMPSLGLISVFTYKGNIYGITSTASHASGQNYINNGYTQIWEYYPSSDTWLAFANNVDFGNNILPDGSTYSGNPAFVALQGAMTGTLFLHQAVGYATTTGLLRVYKFVNGAINQAQTPENGSQGTGTSSGSITSITWQSPRTIFSNENFVLRAQGTANKFFAPEVVAEGGTILLNAGTLQLDSTGSWYFSMRLLSSYQGFFKVTDTVSGVSSTWGYCFPQPGADFQPNTVYAKYFDLATTHTLANYQIGQTDLMFLGYATDLGSSDLSNNYSFDIKENGTTVVYNDTFSDLIPSYFSIGSSLNYAMATSRYILAEMNMPNGADTKDGLIINLSLPLSTPANQGYYNADVVVTSGGASYVLSYSAYWYLNGQFTLAITFDKPNYNPATGAIATITVANPTAVFGVFDTVQYQIVPAGNTSSIMNSGTISTHAAIMTAAFTVPTPPATYWFIVNISKTGVGYTLSAYAPFVVNGQPGGNGTCVANCGSNTGGQTATSDPLKAVHAWLATMNLDNMAGTWGLTLAVSLLVLILCLIAGFAAGVAKLGFIVGVIGFLFTWGFSMLANFADMWLVILLAIVAGVVLAGMLTKGFGIFGKDGNGD